MNALSTTVNTDNIAPGTKDLLGAIESINDSYTPRVQKFTRWVREYGYPFNSPESIIEASKAFLRYLQEAGWVSKNGTVHDYSAQGINGHIFAIRNRIRYLIDHAPSLSQSERYMLGIELKNLRPHKINSNAVPSEKFLSLQEIRTFISQAPIRESLLVEFLYATGLRITEALTVRLSSIKSLHDGVKIEVRGKGKKGRDVYCTRDLIGRIRTQFNGSTYLFETRRSYRNRHTGGRPYRREYLYQRLRDLGKRIIGRPITPHMLRHSFIDSTIRQFDIEAVSKYVGHANVSTTVNQYLSRTLGQNDIMQHIDTIRRTDPTP